MPTPDDYEREYDFWPWGELLKHAVSWVEVNIAEFGAVFDYMCGTGFLLHEIKLRRPDLRLAGCSLDASYIHYGLKKYPNLRLELADALLCTPPFKPELVICTAGLHHLPRQRQPEFLSKLASELSRGSFLLLGEEVVRDYQDEVERRKAVLQLSGRLLNHLVERNAPDMIVQAAIDVQSNDLFEHGEFKVSFSQLVRMIDPHFVLEHVVHTWPDDETQIGDFLLICRRR